MNNFSQRGELIFARSQNDINLNRFFSFSGADGSALTGGIAGLYRFHDESGLYDGRGLNITDFYQNAEITRMEYASQLSRYRQEITSDGDSGVYVLKSSVTNVTASERRFFCANGRFTLQDENFEVYTQSSGWLLENQGAWQPVVTSVSVSSQGVRTCEGATPFICIRNKDTKAGFALHLLPKGMWKITVSKKTDFTGKTFLVLEFGMNTDGLQFCLQGRETIWLPEILFYSFEDHQLGAEKLHRYLARMLAPGKKTPVVYNSWFCDFDRIDSRSLLRQAATAKKIGCDCFVVDAGWFGNGALWTDCVGDWQENQTGAFCGRMAEFSQNIRELGLRFGLWLEPERAVPTSKMVHTHPEFYLPADNGMYLLNFADDNARKYIFEVSCRLIDTYHITFLKCDFNISASADSGGSNFYRYYIGFYQYISALKERYPQLYLEGCSSGGLRSELTNANCFDSHFLSDTVNPVEVLRIYQGAILRTHPRAVTRWIVIHSGKIDVRRYDDAEKRTARVFACGDATWNKVTNYNLDFLFSIYIGSGFGISSDICGFNKECKMQLKKFISFCKQEQDFFISCHCFQLVDPIVSKYDLSGWTGIQYADKEQHRSIVAVTRLESTKSRCVIRLHDLDPAGCYQIREWNRRMPDQYAIGAELMYAGIVVEQPEKYSGKILIVEQAEEFPAAKQTTTACE